jgi:hypothetical protein
MFQTLSCVYMPLGTWADVKVHSYHALTCVSVVVCVAISAMDVNHIDTYSPGTVVNFPRAGGSVVLAESLGPSDCVSQ